MAKLFNLARVTTATIGAGTMTLGGAVSGFLTFSLSGVSNGDVVAYAIRDGANSEIGYGTYTSAGSTLTRTVRKSTNADAAISLSGNAEVVITPSSVDLVQLDLALLTTLSLADDAADWVKVYDTSAAEWKKVLGRNLGFTQVGTGAALRALRSKLGEVFSVKDFGAAGDGTTDDTAEIQAAIDACVANGGGEVYFPASTGGYKTSAQLLIDRSGYSTRFQGSIWLRGDGSGSSYITNATYNSAVVKYLGAAASIDSSFRISGIRISGSGSPVSGSIGLQIRAAAYAAVEEVIVEGFDYNFDATDLEQTCFINSNFRWGAHGMRFNGASSITGSNSINFYNCAISNNSGYGIYFYQPNSVSFFGGSIQYNGTIGGGAGQYGLTFEESGTAGGYGVISLEGLVLEGNGGISDLVFNQTTGNSSVTMSGVSFTRTSIGYATYNVSITGSATNNRYLLTGTTFTSGVGYSASVGRPNINNANSNAKVFDDGTNHYQNSDEQPAWAPAALTNANQRINGTLAVNTTSAAIGVSSVHAGTNQNYFVQTPFTLGTGVVIGSINDAADTLLPLELRASQLLWSGGTSFMMPTGSGLDTGQSAGNTLLLRAYDVNGTAYVTFATLTANDTPTMNLSSAVTCNAKTIVRGTVTAGSGIGVAGGGVEDPVISAAAGVSLQTLQNTYATNAPLTTAIPYDDTTPLIAEGTQILSQAITPAASANTVLCSVQVGGVVTAADVITVALFRGNTCVQAKSVISAGADLPTEACFQFLDSPATTSATTYSVRVGPISGTIYLNGLSTGRKFGGTSTCTLIVTEVKG